MNITVLGAGAWGTALARLLLKAPPSAQVLRGCASATSGNVLRTDSASVEHGAADEPPNRVTLWGHIPEWLEEIRRDGSNERFLPGVKLADEITIHRSAEIELGTTLQPKFGPDGLIPCITQDVHSGEVDASYLYSGARLAIAREELAGQKIRLSELAQKFVNAGVSASESARRRRRHIVQAVISGLVIISLIFAGLSAWVHTFATTLPLARTGGGSAGPDR